MCNKLLCFVVVLSFAGAAFAGQGYSDGGDDHSACNPDNWDMGEVPDDCVTHPSSVVPQWHTDAQMMIDDTICVIGDGCSIASFSFHPGVENGVRNCFQMLDGGSLCVGDWGINLGRGGNGPEDDGTHGKLFMSGGQIDTALIEIPGHWNHASNPIMNGTLVMQDGVIYAGWINMSPNIYAIGNLMLYGGVIDAEWLEMDSATASIEVGGGVLIVNEDDTTDFQQYIDDGWITPAPGYSTLQLDYDVTNPGRTTLRAVSDMDPSPADHSQVGEGSVTALTWIMPTPRIPGGTVSCDVYFGSPEDRKWSSLDDPNDPSAEAAYWAAGGADGDWIPSEIGLPLLESDNTTGSAAVTVAADEYYSWKVVVIDKDSGGESDPNVPDLSYVFEFDTTNQRPVVEAGNNLYSFLDGGPRTITLDGTLVEDDGVPIEAVPTWSVLTAQTPFEDGPQTTIPSASYSFVGSPSQWNAQIQMSIDGDYTMQLDADDTDLQAVPDTMIIFLRDTACEATQIYPGYDDPEAPGDLKALDGDLNEDCEVKLSDFALLASEWLLDAAMDDTTEYIPE